MLTGVVLLLLLLLQDLALMIVQLSELHLLLPLVLLLLVWFCHRVLGW